MAGLALFAAAKVCPAASIFSASGLGEIQEPIDVRCKAMGRTSLAFTQARNPSKSNPAVWCTFDQTAIAVSFISEQRAVKDHGQSHTLFGATPGAVRAFVPVGYDAVFGAGLWPYTSAEFSVSERFLLEHTTIPDSSYVQRVERRGGIHLACFGVAKRLTPSFWVGFNLDLPFGSIEEVWERTFEIPNWVGTRDAITRTYSGVIPTIGTVLLVGDNVALGASYTPEVRLDSAGEVSNSVVREAAGGNRTTLPTRASIGGSYRLGGSLVVAAEVKTELWERAYHSDADREMYSDVVAGGIGLAYLPGAGRKASYYRRVSLFLGGYAGSSYYKSGQPPEVVGERFLTFGLMLPFAEEQATLTCSFELGKRGELSRNEAEEIVYRQSIGICGWEKWFERE